MSRYLSRLTQLILLVTTSLSCLTATGCKAGINEADLTHYRGLIDDQFLSFLEKNVQNGDTLVISSNGGESDLGLLSSIEIEKKKVNIIVDGSTGFCLSGCAEYIITSAESVIALNKPIIGYHQNPQIIKSILDAEAVKDMEFCTALNEQVMLGESLLRRNQLNVDFWEVTLGYLNLRFSEVHYFDAECPGLVKVFRNELWLPNSSQIKNIIGLDVNGAVCADDFEYCQKQVDVLWAEGTSIIIGTKQHISRGSR